MPATSLSDAIWERLVAGRELSDLDLPRREHRIVVGALHLAGSRDVRALKGVTLKSLDFGGANLDELQWHDAEIDDCDFSSAKCTHWRMWRTRISNSSFRRANLTESMLGAVINGTERNTWTNVDFRNATMRHTMFISAAFSGCDFSNARIVHVDFGGSTFKDCRFAGTLEDVMFWEHTVGNDAVPLNTMEGVDMASAVLRHVDFRNLDASSFVLPTNPEHIIIKDYQQTLDCVLAYLGADPSVEAGRLLTVLRAKKKWCKVGTRIGILNRHDLRELGAEQVAERALDACSRTRGDAS